MLTISTIVNRVHRDAINLAYKHSINIQLTSYRSLPNNNGNTLQSSFHKPTSSHPAASPVRNCNESINITMATIARFTLPDAVYFGEYQEVLPQVVQVEEKPSKSKKGKKDSARSDPEEAAAKKLKHGYGVLKSKASGDMYEGRWEQDTMQGQGRITFARSGERYEGDFVANQYNGFGKYTWADGSTYEGEFSYGLVHGKGKYIDVDRSVWTGTFVNGSIVNGTLKALAQ